MTLGLLPDDGARRAVLDRIIERASADETQLRGVAAQLEIGLVGAGDIEGILVKNDGRGFEGLDVELIDATGNVVASTRSDFDGFILFERVAYGRYGFRLSAESAIAAGVERSIDKTVEISPEKSVVRLGPIRIQKASQIATAFSAGGAIGVPR